MAKGGDGHHRTIESLALTVGLDAATVRRLDAFRRRRNTAEYDHAGVTSDDDADEMGAMAESIRNRVVAWLAANHPSLVARLAT